MAGNNKRQKKADDKMAARLNVKMAADARKQQQAAVLCFARELWPGLVGQALKNKTSRRVIYN